MRLAIIIPALNEAGNIRRLIGEIPSQVPAVSDITIVVVDNGSTDDTAVAAQEAGAMVVQEPRRGYGYACAAGVGVCGTADVLVFIDGDGSFDPAEMTLLLQPILTGQADLVFGSRSTQTEPGAMPPHQRFGNQLVSRMMGLLYGLHVTDLGPYRAIRRDALLTLDMREMTFGWPTEMMVKAARRGYQIVEVPVHYRKRWSGQSKVSGTLRGTLLATYFILGVTLRYAFMPNNASKVRPRR
jgi:glycosyltransferase involved in cell wall biosynthesis